MNRIATRQPNLRLSRIGQGHTDIALTPEDLRRIDQIIPKEYAATSTMLPMNLDPNGLFQR